jgi:molybdenum cofactor cytidylyltransferase
LEIVGILLCGGSAVRFGGDKLLAGKSPLVERAARTFVVAVPRVLAVIPPGRAALRAILERAGCEVLESDRTQFGMGSTLAAGVEAASSAQGWIVALGDMPSLRPATIRAVQGALEAGAVLAAPFDASGRRGHPVGFAAEMREELLALEGDVGAREVLARHAAELKAVATDDPGILIDIDTREDFDRLGA